MVRLQDEKAALINIYFWHDNPYLATDFVNILAKTYIEDFVANKVEVAKTTLKTIDDQLLAVERKLAEAEYAVLSYKEQTKVWDVGDFKRNTSKKLAELNQLKENAELKNEDLLKLSQLLQADTISRIESLNFETIGDQTYKEALEKIRKLEQAKSRLYTGYRGLHPRLVDINGQIRQIKEDINRSLIRTLATRKKQIQALEEQIQSTDRQLRRVPQMERDLHFLEHQIFVHQDLYDSLANKKSLSTLSTASQISFHRILEVERVPESTIKPILAISMGVSCLLATLFSFFLVHIIRSLKGVFTHVNDIEEKLNLPTRTMVSLPAKWESYVSQGFVNLTADLVLEEAYQIISLTSYKSQRGKWESSCMLAYTLASMGYKTLLINADPETANRAFPYTDIDLDMLQWDMEAAHFPRKMIERGIDSKGLNELRQTYNWIIIHAPPMKNKRYALSIMKACDISLLLTFLHNTKISHSKNAQKLIQEYEVKNVELLLLDIHRPSQTIYPVEFKPENI